MNIITSIVVIIISLVIIVFANDSADNRCVENGGQIIRNSTKLNHGCIMPVGKR